jgi:hypothetical protein
MKKAERRARVPEPEIEKTCTRCSRSKPLLAFYRHGTASHGRAAVCIECQKEEKRQWRLNNVERVREQNRARREAPDLRRTRMRDVHLRRYGLDEAGYQQLVRDQHGLCRICHRPEITIDLRTGDVKRLAVDHDHATGMVRGLLCSRCNTALGLFDDDIDRLQAAVEYLRGAVLAPAR